jgi:hypothetical protein
MGTDQARIRAANIIQDAAISDYFNTTISWREPFRLDKGAPLSGQSLSRDCLWLLSFLAGVMSMRPLGQSAVRTIS